MGARSAIISGLAKRRPSIPLRYLPIQPSHLDTRTSRLSPGHIWSPNHVGGIGLEALEPCRRPLGPAHPEQGRHRGPPKPDRRDQGPSLPFESSRRLTVRLTSCFHLRLARLSSGASCPCQRWIPSPPVQHRPLPGSVSPFSRSPPPNQADSCRPLLDIATEEYQSAIEEFSTKLVLENRTVQHENKQLSILLREYEATLEGVMCKFRSLAVRPFPSSVRGALLF